MNGMDYSISISTIGRPVRAELRRGRLFGIRGGSNILSSPIHLVDMAKKNKAALFVGLAAAGVAVYLLMKSKPAATPATTAATPVIPYAPTVAAATSAVSAGTSLLNSLINPLKSLFGGSSTPTFTPVSVASTGSTAAPSPASSINYINPGSAPTLAITAPTIDNSVASNDDGSGDDDLSNIFL
jgi:peptidoglycan hydrolase-like amidase